MASKFFGLKGRHAQANQKNYKYDVLAPIELMMEKEKRDQPNGVPGSRHNENQFNLKAMNRNKGKQNNKFEAIKTITSESLQQNDVGHGMISYYNEKGAIQDSMRIKPKLAVCITMYNEARKELEASLEGILRNMKHFKKNLGIENEEIVVVVVYDGIDRINDDIDPDENMIQYFDLWDRTEGKKYNKTSFTIPKKYNKFKEQLERSKFQVEELRNKEFQIFKTNEKLADEFQQYISGISQDERTIEAKKADFLYSVKQKAKKYIDSKNNNALIKYSMVIIVFNQT